MDIYELGFNKELKRPIKGTTKRSLDLHGGDLNDFMYIKDGKLYIKDEEGDYNIGGGGSDSTPAGVVTSYGGSTAPTGWLLCDGSAVSRGTYSALFTAIGTTYGVGDGSTTFNVPDVRGRVMVGKSADTEFDTLGESGGEKTHQLSTGELATHSHTATTSGLDGAHSHYFEKRELASGSTYTGLRPNDYSSDGHILGGGAADTYHSHTITVANAGSNTAHNNLQPYITFNCIIKT